MTIDRLIALAESGASPEGLRRALAQALEAEGASQAAVARLMEHVRDGIALRGAEREAGSRIGGPGLLPAGEEWPRDPRGRPLTFVAAMDLRQLPSLEPLPPDGTLLFFWGFEFHTLRKMDFVAVTRVHHLPAGHPMEERRPPDGGRELERLPLDGVVMPIAGEIEKVRPQIEDAAEREALFEAAFALGERLYTHQLLGASRDVQGPVLDEVGYWFDQAFQETCERYSEAERTGEGWILLAQIDEDRDVPSLVIGDAGSLYFVMPEADLRARRFDRVMGIMQCH